MNFFKHLVTFFCMRGNRGKPSPIKYNSQLFEKTNFFVSGKQLVIFLEANVP